MLLTQSVQSRQVIVGGKHLNKRCKHDSVSCTHLPFLSVLMTLHKEGLCVNEVTSHDDCTRLYVRQNFVGEETAGHKQSQPLKV